MGIAIYSHSTDYITLLNNWLQEASQEVINHFTYSVRGIQLIQDHMQGEFVEVRFYGKWRTKIWHVAVGQWVSSKQSQGGKLLQELWMFLLCLPGSCYKGFWVYTPRYSWLLMASEGIGECEKH